MDGVSVLRTQKAFAGERSWVMTHHREVTVHIMEVSRRMNVSRGQKSALDDESARDEKKYKLIQYN